MNKVIFFSAALLFSFLPCTHASETEEKNFSAKGKIIAFQEEEKEYIGEKNPEFRMFEQKAPETIIEKTFEIEIKSGVDTGKKIFLSSQIESNPFDINPKIGDIILLYGNEINGERMYSIQGFWHLDMLIFWMILLVIAILLFGKNQGIKSLASLFVSLFIIFYLYIPALQNGESPLFWAILCSFLISIFTLPLIHGFSLKAVISILGTTVGIIIAVILSGIMIFFSNFNGLGTEEMRLLTAQNIHINPTGILFSGIIIGALGAIMDVAVSISSGLQEVKEHKPKISRKELFISGMNIGKDILGSMLNTLIFAYIGTSVGVILLVSHTNTPLIEFLNYGFVAEEIIRAIIGSFGLMVSIPVTAIIASFLYGKKN
jgi:uncharacterized membrane protein